MATNAPASLQVEVAETLRAYQVQAAWEAQFVKALDKFEPLVHLYNERGKALIHCIQMTVTESVALKTPYLDAFPHIKHFCLTLHTVMEADGYFPIK